MLYLSGNDLSGAIPARLGELSELKELVLSNNELTGGVPSWLGGLADLEELWLSNNSLTGAIPAGLAELDLEYLYLAGNELTGCVPAGLGRVANNDLAGLGLASCVNRAPEFSTSTYVFSVAENAATTTLVGTVTATDPDGDSVTYTIRAGDDARRLRDSHVHWWVITVAGALDRDTAATHTLTVRASDGNGGTAVGHGGCERAESVRP